METSEAKFRNKKIMFANFTILSEKVLWWCERMEISAQQFRSYFSSEVSHIVSEADELLAEIRS